MVSYWFVHNPYLQIYTFCKICQESDFGYKICIYVQFGIKKMAQRIIKLYTGKDQKSYFEEIDILLEQEQALGFYSAAFMVNELFFRETKSDAVFEWHNAPAMQYIVYLSGSVEIHASGGEIRRFQAGDILLAMDLEGQGHISKILEPGHSLVIKVK